MPSQSRDLRVNLSADARQLERGLQRAERAMTSYERSIEDANAAMMRLDRELQRDIDTTLADVEAQNRRATESFQQLGTGIAVGSAGIAAGLGLAGYAAVQWESDWAAVTKTIDGSPAQMQALEDSLRGLSTQIPVTHSDLAQIAASAGQLGIESQNVVGFTETVAAMGVTTNLTVEEAAMQMAKFANIMGTPQDEIDRLGATIVDLGNNSATTEADILNMGMRIAGAGRTVGLTEDEVLSFSAALSSVGLEAEGGGNAFSRVMVQISSAAQQGGQELQGFAEVSEMSADEFARAMSERPAEAMAAFITGLGGIKEEGGNVFATLKSLGIVDTETRDALLRAAGASDMLNKSLGIGAQAWEENAALIEEATKWYATTESQVKMARNSIEELGISMGESLLPMLGAAAERVQNWGQAYSSLNEEQQGLVTGIGGTVSAVGLLGGALMFAGPKIIEFRDNMMDLSQNGTTGFRRGLGKVAAFLSGPYGLAIAGVLAGVGIWLDQKAQQIAAEQEWADVLSKSAGVIDENVKMHAIKTLQESKALEQAEQAGVAQTKVLEGLLQEGEARSALIRIHEEVQGAMYTTEQGMQHQIDNNKELAAALEELLPKGTRWRDLTGEQQQALVDLVKTMDGQIETQKNGEEQAKLYNEVMGQTANQYQTATEKAQAYREEVNQLVDRQLSAIDAEIAWEQSIDDASAALEENGATLDLNTQAGRDNMQVLRGMISDGNELIATMIENGASAEDLRKKQKELRNQIRDTADGFGAGATQAENYADMIRDIPNKANTDIRVDATGKWLLTPNGMSGSSRGNYLEFATGGAVQGAGTAISDNIDAKLSPGEHVWTAAEVQAAGGQEAVYALRDLVKSGALKLAGGGAVQKFAKGGEVLPDHARIIRDHTEETRVNIQKLMLATIDGLAGDMGREIKKYFTSGGPVVKQATKWEGTPYSWGGGGIGGPSYGFAQGAGIRGFDCSSLMQYAWYHGTGGRVHLPRVTYDQINTGRAVSRGNARPGDLVFPHRGHVGMYVGGGRMFHTFATGSTAGYRSMYPAPLAIRRPGRYDDGGLMYPGDTGINTTRRPERVLDPATTAAFDRLVDGLLAGRGAAVTGAATTVVDTAEYHIHHVPGYSTVQDLQRADERRQRAARVGRPR